MHSFQSPIFISIVLVFSACSFGNKLKVPKIEVTKITYTINLTEQDDQGFYIVQSGQPISIKAIANSRYQDQILWNTTFPMPIDGEFAMSVPPKISQEEFLAYFKRHKTIEEKQILYLVIKDAGSATEYKLKCFFTGDQHMVNGVDLFQGKQEFKVRVQK
jgi:hypothetical protein